MDKTVLVDHDLEEGKRLLRALDEVGVPVVAALWYCLPESDVWRYIVASPLVEELGPRKTYARIESVRASTLPPVNMSVDQITAARTTHPPLIGELRYFAGTPGAPYIGGVWLNRAMVGETYVERAYVYRAERLIGVSGTTDMVFAVPGAGGHRWAIRSGKMTTRDGFIVDVTIENYSLKVTTGRHGINAVFYVLSSVAQENGKKVGDIQRMSVIDGRLRTVDPIATGVELVD
jgi:hypothetical protein